MRSTLLAGDPLDVNVDGLLTIDDASLAMTTLVASLAFQSQSPLAFVSEEASAVQPAIEPQEVYYDSLSQSESEALEASTSSALNYDPTPSPSYAPTPSPTPPPPTPSTAPCPSCSPPADGPTEAIGWDIPVGLSAGLNGAIDGLKTKIGSNVLATRPFAGVPDDFQLPIIVPFYGVAWTPSIPVPGAAAIRSWTIEDLIDFYLAPYISVLSGVDYAMGVKVIATRDPIIVGCGCNMKNPQIASVGPPISLSGMFTFDVGATVNEVDFNDTHRYPRKDPNGYGPAHPYYSGDPGNLVDEVATVIVRPEIRLGINTTIPFIGTAINEEFKFKMLTVQQQIKCSEGTPLPLASPAPAPPNLP